MNADAQGAYGREASLDDWITGKDFRFIPRGPYFSIRDTQRLLDQGYTTVTFFKKSGSFTVTLKAA